MTESQSAIRRILNEHPAGVTAAATAILMLIAKRIGVSLSEDEAVAIVGGLVVIVSAFTPRFRVGGVPIPRDLPEDDATGPDDQDIVD